MVRRGISYVKKIEAVKKYKRGEGSQDGIALGYGVPDTTTSVYTVLHNWLA